MNEEEEKDEMIGEKETCKDMKRKKIRKTKGKQSIYIKEVPRLTPGSRSVRPHYIIFFKGQNNSRSLFV